MLQLLADSSTSNRWILYSTMTLSGFILFSLGWILLAVKRNKIRLEDGEKLLGKEMLGTFVWGSADSFPVAILCFAVMI